MELTGFRRVTLAAGEEKKVVFCLKADQTAFWMWIPSVLRRTVILMGKSGLPGRSDSKFR